MSSAYVETMPKLTVCISVYNHAQYIAQCLESLLDQDRPFPIEILVGNDCSKDASAQVLSRFQENHPGVVRVFNHERNIGAAANYLFLHAQARGQYVAHLDGDDYALPGKLVRQVAFLDAHPECIMVAHQVWLEDMASGERYGHYLNFPAPPVSDLLYLVEHSCFFAHSSKMYRRVANTYAQVPDDCADFWLHVWHASQGKVGYIDEPLGVYRTRNPNSMTGSASPWRNAILESHLQAYDLAGTLGIRQSRIVQLKAIFALDHALRMLRLGDFASFKSWLDRSWDFCPHVSKKQVLAFRLKYLPALLRTCYEVNLRLKSMLKMI
ncbi:glycosyltransferase [Chitiniphilus purpureus]|uniref:Glycosyltransferase n=1 Tax=Chitiniphilus purpureus TaxID=2981137 RepID=A0ABY6DJF8_9NEIS|nr:glycosyltransferase [Chitiniphilus sp. CD1]UXY14480.1 glycosyltransferase [Chitiniphilus sp. CD1]